MTKRQFTLAASLMVAVIASGIHLLMAQELPVRGSRATPKQIREHLANHAMLTMTTVHSAVRSIRDLRSLADDLNESGQKTESTRLKKIIDEIVRHADAELTAKKALVANLNEEIEELKRTIDE